MYWLKVWMGGKTDRQTLKIGITHGLKGLRVNNKVRNTQGLRYGFGHPLDVTESTMQCNMQCILQTAKDNTFMFYIMLYVWQTDPGLHIWSAIVKRGHVGWWLKTFVLNWRSEGSFIIVLCAFTHDYDIIRGYYQWIILIYKHIWGMGTSYWIVLVVGCVCYAILSLMSQRLFDLDPPNFSITCDIYMQNIIIAHTCFSSYLETPPSVNNCHQSKFSRTTV